MVPGHRSWRIHQIFLYHCVLHIWWHTNCGLNSFQLIFHKKIFGLWAPLQYSCWGCHLSSMRWKTAAEHLEKYSYRESSCSATMGTVSRKYFKYSDRTVCIKNEEREKGCIHLTVTIIIRQLMLSPSVVKTRSSFPWEVATHDDCRFIFMSRNKDKCRN